jgi:sulfate/thiosulfate transport system ATP-binding protein
MSILLDHVSKRFGASVALDEVSLEVAEGELFVLLGGSGCGKSTALRIIAGLTPPDDGRIFLQGQRVDSLPPQKRGVGFVFQNYSLFRHMTVGENIEFGMRIHGFPPEERIRRREELLNLIGLDGMDGFYPGSLSGGQQQRIAVARALAYRPAVLLMDEPFGALDVRTRSQLRQSLREIQRALKVTTILVTHDQEEAFELGDRIGVLDRGHLVEVGPPTTLYRRPMTELVASFLGTSNLLLGEIREEKLYLGKAVLALPPDVPAVKGPMEVKVLIRPEDLEVHPPGPWIPGKTLGEGRVRETFQAGPVLRLKVGIPVLQGVPILAPEPVFGQSEPTLISHALPEAGDLATLPPGAPVYLSVRNLHVIPHEGFSLLVCIDGSELSRRCLEFAATVASRMHGRMVIIGVAEKPNEEGRARQGLSEAAQAYSNLFPNLKTRFRTGNAADRILEEMEGGEYGMAVLGYRGRHGPARSMGSTAEKLVMLSRVPVLIVPEARPALKKILVCMASGITGRSDVIFAGRLAGNLGAEATLLHVSGGADSGAPRGRPGAVTEDYLRQLATERLARGILTLKLMGVRSEMKIRHGLPPEEILEEARSGDYDLVSVGAPDPPRWRGTERRLIIDDLLQEGKRPVLVVPAPPGEES